jgi:hypothetical protein
MQQMISKTPTEGAGGGTFAGKKVLTSDNSQFTIPVYYFNNSTTKASVNISGCFGFYDTDDKTRTSLGCGNPIPNVPIPPGAAGGQGSDAQIEFWNASTGEEWGFWQFGQNPDGSYFATNGFRYHTTSTFNGRFADGLGGRGGGTTYLAGLIRPWEIQQGHIDHAIAWASSGPSPDCRYPAAKSDGGGFGGISGTDYPEGARIQLDPTLTDTDFTTMGLSAAGKTIAKALQQYGAYVIDNSGSTKLYVEYQGTANWPTNTSNANYVGRYTVSGIPLTDFRVITGPTDPDAAGKCPPVTGGGGSTTPPPADAANPAPPTTVTATSGNGQITVRWSGATDDVGVTGYVVRYRAAGSTAAFTDVPVNGNTYNAYTITGLTNGQGYNIFVRSKDAAGKTSVDSGLAQATPSASATNPPLSRDNGNCPALPSTLYGTSTLSVNVPSSGT